VNGRRKGARAELDVAKKIGAWWQWLEPKAEFHRTPLSGGWASPTARAEFKTSGDLVTTATRFPFTVEVKAREGWSMENFFKGRPCPVWAWWNQAQAQAREQDGEPMLWCRHNREPWIVLLREGYFQSLKAGTRILISTTCKQQGWGRWPKAERGWPPVAYYGVELLRLPPSLFALPSRTS
jgi:hypothetical protein